MWREARGAVLRREYEDVMALMKGANEVAYSGFLNNINQTIDEVNDAYAAASTSGRKALLVELRNSALGLGISPLHAQSRFVLGDDALVRQDPDRAIDKRGRRSGGSYRASIMLAKDHAASGSCR
jgi:hypothetical protein